MGEQTLRSIGAAHKWRQVRSVLLYFELAFVDPRGDTSSKKNDDDDYEKTIIVPCMLNENDGREARRNAMSAIGSSSASMIIRVVPWPLGARARLIVALQRHAPSNHFWHNGCGVDLGGCFVVVESDGQDVCIFLFVLLLFVIILLSHLHHPDINLDRM